MDTTTQTHRMFDLGDILSVTTGRLVSPRHIDGIYDILGYMTGESLFTHQLPRASDECRPFLLAQHPALRGAPVPEHFSGKEHVDLWLMRMKGLFGNELPVAPLNPEDHTHIDPLTELTLMGVPAERIIPVVIGEE